jgi:hypothetical protein
MEFWLSGQSCKFCAAVLASANHTTWASAFIFLSEAFLRLHLTNEFLFFLL